jgi:hypothetical protein
MKRRADRQNNDRDEHIIHDQQQIHVQQANEGMLLKKREPVSDGVRDWVRDEHSHLDGHQNEHGDCRPRTSLVKTSPLGGVRFQSQSHNLRIFQSTNSEGSPPVPVHLRFGILGWLAVPSLD